MPAHVHPLFQRAAFDAETLHVMGEVYDDILAAYPDLHDSTIAEAVLQAAQTGERDPDRLRLMADALLGAAGKL